MITDARRQRTGVMSARRDERRSRPRQKDQATGVLPLVPLVPGALKPPAPNMPPGPAPPPGPPGAPWNRPETPLERLRREFREQEEAADKRRAVENVDFKGGKYTGSVVDGVPDGFGAYEYTTKVQLGEPKPLTELQLAQQVVDRVVAAQKQLEEEYTEELRKRNLGTQAYTNAQQLREEARRYYDYEIRPEPGDLERPREYWQEKMREYKKRMDEAKPKHDAAEAVWKPFRERYDAKRAALIEEARAARSKREALDVVVTESEKESMWKSIESFAGGKSVGQRVFAKWATAKDGGEYLHSKYWYALFRADPETVDGDNDLRKRFVNEVFVKMSTSISQDFAISKKEFMRYFEDRADGKIEVDIPVPDNQTTKRFVSYEGLWSKGEVVGMGKMDVMDEIGVNTELSGSFGPGFVPIQVDMVSYTRNGDKLVVDGLKMVRGEWVGSGGAKGANSMGVWKLFPFGTVRFDGDSDLKSGIFLKAELSGKVAFDFDTGEKITANVKGSANNIKIEGEVQVEVDGIKYNGAVTGYGENGKPIVTPYDSNPPPPPPKASTRRRKENQRRRAQEANAKSEYGKKESKNHRPDQDNSGSRGAEQEQKRASDNSEEPIVVYWDVLAIVFWNMVGRMLVSREYEGPKGEERVVKETFPDGMVLEYEGPKGDEHMVKKTFPDGHVEELEGPKGKERTVKFTYPDGRVLEVEGPKGKERGVKMTNPDGSVDEYEGPKGKERAVKKTYPDGRVLEVEGPKGKERGVRMTNPDGSVDEYEGPQGEERLVRRTFPDGSVEEYEGPKGEELPVGPQPNSQRRGGGGGRAAARGAARASRGASP